MTRTPSRSVLRRFLAPVCALVVVAGVAFLGGAADAGHGHNGGPVTAQQIPNVTLVENEIKAYYGDHVASDGTHEASATSAYADEVRGIEAKALKELSRRPHTKGKPAVVFDVDDTTLLTYNYEVANQFAYFPDINAQYVLGEKFPAVFGMNTLATALKDKGYSIFFVTGRPASQAAATLGNLALTGYPAPTGGANGLYTKPNSGDPFPAYVDCTTDGNPACSTIEYKSSTRKHIESLGYDIVANFGDQYSDLSGGYADRSVKMPNPMYYLP